MTNPIYILFSELGPVDLDWFDNLTSLSGLEHSQTKLNDAKEGLYQTARDSSHTTSPKGHLKVNRLSKGRQVKGQRKAQYTGGPLIESLPSTTSLDIKKDVSASADYLVSKEGVTNIQDTRATMTPWNKLPQGGATLPPEASPALFNCDPPGGRQENELRKMTFKSLSHGNSKLKTF